MKLSEALRKGAEKVGWRQARFFMFRDKNGNEIYGSVTNPKNVHRACALGCIYLGGYRGGPIWEKGLDIAAKNDYQRWPLAKIADWLEEQGE